MSLLSKAHYGDNDGLKVLSYNAIYSFVLSNRNYGKTWAFKRRAFRRALKHGKKTLWLRMFEKEVKEATNTFYSSKDLQAYCGISVYDKQSNPKGNFKQVGHTFYYRTSPKSNWRWFLKICKLNDADAIRSADDVDMDTIVFDEFTKTPNKYKLYRGNIVTDFIDIFYSSKREHQVRCIFLGNKESINNPFFTYFNIKPLPTMYEGIRSYREGSIVIQQINNQVEDETTAYSRKLKALLDGTAYGNYIFKQEYKQQQAFKARKTPQDAEIYVQLMIESSPLKISVYNGYFYVNDKIDNTRNIYCDVLMHKFMYERQLVKKHKQFFNAFIEAISDNRVYYANAKCHESIQPFLQWLSI